MSERVWSTSTAFAYSGAALITVSVFLPWTHTADGADSVSMTPIGESLLRPALILLLVALGAGAALLHHSGDPAIIGCVGALWLNTTLVIWLAGARIASFIPDSILPDHVAVHLGLGATVGLVGGLVLVAGVVLVLLNLAWSYEPPSFDIRRGLPGLVLMVACIAVRNLGWVSLRAGDFHWSVDFDVVPFVGDALTVALVGAAVVLLILVLSPRRWAVLLLEAHALTIAIFSMLSFVVKSLATEYGRSLIHRLAFVDNPATKITLTSTAGPVCSFALGLAMAVFGIAQWKVAPSAGMLRRLTPITSRGRAARPTDPMDDVPF